MESSISEWPSKKYEPYLWASLTEKAPEIMSQLETIVPKNTRAHAKNFKHAHAHARARENLFKVRTRTHAHANENIAHERARARFIRFFIFWSATTFFYQ
jgi:hypothetical protein